MFFSLKFRVRDFVCEIDIHVFISRVFFSSSLCCIQSPPSVLRRALVDGSLKLYPGGEFVVSTPEDHNGMITDSKNDFEEDEDPKLESVLSLVMDHLDMDPLEHVRKEIQSQCSLWNINAGK